MSPGTTAAKLLRRPGVIFADLEPELAGMEDMSPTEVGRLETRVKYEGYIKREQKSAEKFRRLEHKTIAEDFDFHVVPGLSNEARERWTRVRPSSLGQAGRVPGVRMSDIAVLLVNLEAQQRQGIRTKKAP